MVPVIDSGSSKLLIYPNLPVRRSKPNVDWHSHMSQLMQMAVL